MRILTTLCAGALALISSAMAAPLSYNERTDGDINNDAFDLGFGANIISGIVYGTDTPYDNGNFDFDFFGLTLPKGGILRDLEIAMKPLEGGNRRTPNSFNWKIDGKFDAIRIDSFVEYISFNSTFRESSFIGFNSLPAGMAVYYQLTFNVGESFYGGKLEAIETPLPAALPLFAAGIAGLGFAGRRKRRAQ